MDWFRTGNTPLPKPTIIYCQLYPQEQYSVKSELDKVAFMKSHMKLLPANCRKFCSSNADVNHDMAKQVECAKIAIVQPWSIGSTDRGNHCTKYEFSTWNILACRVIKSLSSILTGCSTKNILRPRWNGCHILDSIFKFTFLNENAFDLKFSCGSN